MSQQTPSSPLLHHEQWEHGARFIPKEKETPSSPQEIAQELLARPGRFRSPLSLGEKIRLKFFIASGALDFFGLGKYFSYTFSQKREIPFAWQVLFKYLKREGVLENMTVIQPITPYGIAGFFSVALFSPPSKEILAVTRNRGLFGQGNAADFLEALSRGIGELLERFFLAHSRKTLRASVMVLRQRRMIFLDPGMLSQYSLKQREERSGVVFSDSIKVAWVRGRELFSNHQLLLPAQSVFWRHRREFSEVLLREQNSNGAAGHFTLEEALLSGMYEAVERDSFLIFWLNNLAPPVMDTSHIEGLEFLRMRKDFDRYRLELTFLNVTTDIGIPTFICVLVDRKGSEGKVAVNAGSGWCLEKLLVDLAYKTLATYKNFSTRTSLPSLPDQYVPFSDATMNQEKRILLWQNPEMFQKIQFFLSGPKQTLAEAFPHLPIFRDKKEELAHVTNIFRSLGKGYEVYYYEVRDKILETIGYHVVRVIIPELVHMYLHEINAPLGASRLRTVPKKLGLVAATEWNPLPHPFP